MPAPLKPRTFVVEGCTKTCSLNPHNLPGQVGTLLHSWFEAGNNNAAIIEKAGVLGVRLSHGAVGRHRGRHLVPTEHVEDLSMLPEPPRKLSDLEILEKIIQRGSQSVEHAAFKVSPELMMKALEMKFKLTQGSIFDNFLGAVAEAMTDETETADAVASADEQAQGEAVVVDDAG